MQSQLDLWQIKQVGQKLQAWHYDRKFKARGYIVDSGAMNPYSENVVTVYLHVGENVDIEDIERTLLLQESE